MWGSCLKSLRAPFSQCQGKSLNVKAQEESSKNVLFNRPSRVTTSTLLSNACLEPLGNGVPSPASRANMPTPH